MIRLSATARVGLPAWLLCIGPTLAAPTGADDEAVAAVCSGTRLEFEAPALGRFDANGDRAISEQEAEGCEGLAVVFERLDLDADGVLSRVEYAAFADVWRRRQRVFTDPD
ncbi:MAG: hypothetical protein V2J02_07795 [Pseudomonadales bacterium]|jgi:hypothetical protein|nr:hypothetical protein [Pseudomonadales bacterium]